MSPDDAQAPLQQLVAIRASHTVAGPALDLGATVLDTAAHPDAPTGGR